MKGAACHLKGRGDFASMFLFEIPPGGSSTPQHHLYEEVIYVLEGTGSTQLEFADGAKRSFEWGPRSMFAIPLNAKYRHFNGSGQKRALMVSTTNMPLVMNVFHNENFIFDTNSEFADRIGKDEYYAGEGDLVLVRPGNHMWETNFVPDLEQLELQAWEDRGAGSSQHHVRPGRQHHARAHLGNAARHLQEGASPRARRACHVRRRHRLLADVVRGRARISCASTGSTAWFSRRPIGSCTSISTPATATARYLATGVGGIRYPLTAAARRAGGGDGTKEAGGFAQHQGRRRPDRIRGSGSAHPSAVARGDDAATAPQPKMDKYASFELRVDQET